MTATIAFDRRSVALGTATLPACPAPGGIGPYFLIVDAFQRLTELRRAPSNDGIQQTSALPLAAMNITSCAAVPRTELDLAIYQAGIIRLQGSCGESIA
jgi:hypothetical protein